MFGQSRTCFDLLNRYSALEMERNGSKNAEYESWIGWIPRNLHLRFFPGFNQNFDFLLYPVTRLWEKLHWLKIQKNIQI